MTGGQRLKGLYEKRPLAFWSAGILIPAAALTLLCILWPDTFYDGFVYRYYWGPIVEDAHYNYVDTSTYAVIVVLGILAVHEIFRFNRIRMDTGIVWGLVPYVVFGGVTRVLEDTGLVRPPVEYLFITPLIYFIIALVVTLPLVVTSYKGAESSGVRRAVLLYSPYVAFSAAYVLVRIFLDDFFLYLLDPGVVIVVMMSFALLQRLLVGNSRNGGTLVLGLQGGSLLTVALLFVSMWTRADGWGVPGVETHWEVALWVPAAALATVGIFAALGTILKRKWEWAGAYAKPLNLLLIGAQMLDGWATFAGIEFFGYAEKHVLPGLLIDAAGSAWIMLPLKAGLVTLAVWMIDVKYREDFRDSRTLLTLIYIVIILLGFGPGFRDMFRLAMGT